MNELELLKEAQNGNEQAFKKIFIKNKDIIFYTISQMVGDVHVAEDLTMETFEKVFKNIKKFTPRYKISAWITKIAKNHTLDYIRAKNIRPRLVELNYMLQDNWNPEKEFIGNEEAIILEDIVSNLKGPCHDIIRLWIDGKKYREISEELNIPLGTVSPYIRNIRKMIMEERNKFGKIKISKNN